MVSDQYFIILPSIPMLCSCLTLNTEGWGESGELGLVQTGMCCNSTYCLYSRTSNVFPLEMMEMDSSGLCPGLQPILSCLVVTHAYSRVALKDYLLGRELHDK